MAKRSLDIISRTLNKAEVESTEIKKIEIEKLVPSQYNDYPMNRIEQTAEDIKERGLRHNLVVWEGERNPQTGEIEKTGRYTIESGHRRLRSIQYGNEKGLFDIRKVDCKVVPAPKSDLHERLSLIQDNREVREETDESKINDYIALKEILSEMKKRGELENSYGRLRDLIATELGVSPSQVSRIERVVNNATEEVREKVKKGEYSLSTASAVAKLSPSQQREVVKGEDKNALQTATKIYREQKEESQSKAGEETPITVTVAEDKNSDIPENTPVEEAEPRQEETQIEETPREWGKDDFLKCLDYVLGTETVGISENTKAVIINMMNGLLMKTADEALEFIE